MIKEIIIIIITIIIIIIIIIIMIIMINNSSWKHLTLVVFAQQNISCKYLETKTTICSLKLRSIILNKGTTYAFSERGIFLEIEKKYLAL